MEIITLEPRDISTSKRFKDFILETFFRDITPNDKSYRLTTKKRLNGKISTHLQSGRETPAGFLCNAFEDKLYELIEMPYIPTKGELIIAITKQHKECIEAAKKIINGINSTNGNIVAV